MVLWLIWHYLSSLSGNPQNVIGGTKTEHVVAIAKVNTHQGQRERSLIKLHVYVSSSRSFKVTQKLYEVILWSISAKMLTKRKIECHPKRPTFSLINRHIKSLLVHFSQKSKIKGFL